VHSPAAPLLYIYRAEGRERYGAMGLNPHYRFIGFIGFCHCIAGFNATTAARPPALAAMQSNL
jgi:hypothetical protein